MEKLKDNWIFENATLDTCEGCKSNTFDTVAECLARREEFCPYKDHLRLIEALSEHLLKVIAETEEVTHYVSRYENNDDFIDDWKEFGKSSFEMACMANGTKLANF